MKRLYIKVITAIMMVTIFMACDDQLDLDPQQNVDTQDQLSTTEGISNFLNGVYSHVAGQTTPVYGGELYGADFNLISELMGANGEVSWSGTFATYRDFWNREQVENNLVLTNNWIRAYEAINMCNLIIANIEVVEESERKRIQGEALALRSSLFFELVRLYALPYVSGATNSQPGIPIVTEPNVQLSDIDEEDFVKRESVETVYARVITDLTTAAELLPEENGIRIGKYGALAFLARVYLQKGDYEGARDAANTVIAQGGYELEGDYSGAFNNESSSTEDIFAIQQSSLFNAGTSNSGLTTFYANSDQSGRDGDIDITVSHLELYEEGDERGQFFYPGVTDNLPKTSKWLVEYAAIPVIRLAEMYLIRAEANFRLGTSVGAAPLEDLNEIRNRAGLEDYDEDLAPLSLEEILIERRRELAFEGHRLHDLKRTQTPLFEGTDNEVSFDSPTLVLPIPRRELDNNSNL